MNKVKQGLVITKNIDIERKAVRNMQCRAGKKKLGSFLIVFSVRTTWKKHRQKLVFFFFFSTVIRKDFADLIENYREREKKQNKEKTSLSKAALFSLDFLFPLPPFEFL